MTYLAFPSNIQHPRREEPPFPHSRVSAPTCCAPVRTHVSTHNPAQAHCCSTHAVLKTLSSRHACPCFKGTASQCQLGGASDMKVLFTQYTPASQSPPVVINIEASRFCSEGLPTSVAQGTMLVTVASTTVVVLVLRVVSKAMGRSFDS